MFFFRALLSFILENFLTSQHQQPQGQLHPDDSCEIVSVCDGKKACHNFLKDFELTGIFHVSMELWYQDSTISTSMMSLSNLLKLNGKNNQKILSLKGSCSVNTSLTTPDHQERMTMCLSRPCPAGSSPLWLFISHWGPGSGSSSSCLQSRALPGW